MLSSGDFSLSFEAKAAHAAPASGVQPSFWVVLQMVTPRSLFSSATFACLPACLPPFSAPPCIPPASPLPPLQQNQLSTYVSVTLTLSCIPYSVGADLFLLFFYAPLPAGCLWRRPALVPRAAGQLRCQGGRVFEFHPMLSIYPRFGRPTQWGPLSTIPVFITSKLFGCP